VDQLAYLACNRSIPHRGANVNSTTEGGETPLLMAAGNNHKKVVKILLHHDADVTAASAGFTALRIATLQGYTEIVQLLHKHAQQQQTGSSVPLVPFSSLPAV
jgi:ankyrin repeat protein